MNILVCIKRVPATGAKMLLTEDEQAIDTKSLGFTFSPHEECAVEEAVKIVEEHGGDTTVLTLGPDAAKEQLQYAMSMGMKNAVLLETEDTADWDPKNTADAILASIQEQQAEGKTFDMLFFGNEAADTGGYQVGIRIAHALDWPCVAGIKQLDIEEGKAIAYRETGNGKEVFEVMLPAVFTMKEGINYPRYPSVPGRLRAKKKEIARSTPEQVDVSFKKVKLKTPVEVKQEVQILGEGAAAAPKVVEMMQELGVVR